ncbi:hypothetical protein D3C87_1103790 [compost metagenome]
MMTSKISKVILLCGGALLTMGNQKCEDKRTLKKIIQMDGITSPALTLPGGGTFDFQSVANQQIYAVLSESPEFTFRLLPPVVVPPAGNSAIQAKSTNNDLQYNLTPSDQLAMNEFSAISKATTLSLQAQGEIPVENDIIAWCLVNQPQARISGNVNAFEMVGKGGITIGFSPAGDHAVNGIGSASLKIELAQLDLSMKALRPITDKVLTATNVSSKQTKTKLNLSINWAEWAAKPSVFYQTPLAQVTKNALTKAVKNLGEQLKSEEWSTRVLAYQWDHIVVVGGTDVGLEAGDQLLIYNEDYYWEGEPCNSRYLGGGAAANAAIAKIEVVWVGDEISRGRIIERTEDSPVQGAKVKLFKFRDPKSAQQPGVQQPVN